MIKRSKETLIEQPLGKQRRDIRAKMKQKQHHENTQAKLDYVVLPRTHSPMYLMHKYWARKPANIVATYIQKYSQPGEVVLDPFMGSGVTVLESVFQQRRAVGIDVNPISSFICRNSGVPVDLDNFNTGFDMLVSKVYQSDSVYSLLYKVLCPKCHTSSEITHIIWKNNYNPNISPEKNALEGQSQPQQDILEIRLRCPTCGALSLTTADEPEFSTLEIQVRKQESEACLLLAKFHIPEVNFDFTYSEDSKFLQLRHNLRTAPKMSNLFTDRAFVMLLWIRSLILALPPSFHSLQELYLFTLTSALGQASKMVWVIDKRQGKQLRKKQVGSWTHHFFWDPSSYFEVNAWNCFTQRYKKIVRGKTESNARNQQTSYNFAISSDFSHLTAKSPVLLLNQSVIDTSLPDNSVDFIFSDPPYGDSIQYGELGSLWAAWLGIDMDQYISTMHQSEITINSRQQKTLSHYAALLDQAFTRLYQILKPNKFMVLTFHNTSIKTRNALLLAVLQAGFDLKQILFQLPPRASIKSMLHYEGSPIGDYYLRFQKVEEIQRVYYPVYLAKLQTISEEEKQSALVDIISEILQRRGEPTYFIWISNLIDEYLYRALLFPLPDFESLLKIIATSSIFQISADGKWWFKDSDRITASDPPLTKRIGEYLEYLLKAPRKIPSNQSKKQFYFNEIYAQFRGVLSPDKFLVNSLIDNSKFS
ncbi:MAG: DNA methyltransferase [Promethearchaeota archaeon]